MDMIIPWEAWSSAEAASPLQGAQQSLIKEALRLRVFPSKLLPSSLQISPSLWPCMTLAELANQAPSSCKAGWLAHMHQRAQTRTAGNESLHQRLALGSSVQ